MAVSRIRNFWTLPVTVIGNAVDELPVAGDLVGGDLAPAVGADLLARRASTPGASFTQAMTSSPYFASGTPITCTSETPGMRVEELLDLARDRCSRRRG